MLPVTCMLKYLNDSDPPKTQTLICILRYSLHSPLSRELFCLIFKTFSCISVMDHLTTVVICSALSSSAAAGIEDHMIKTLGR